MTRLAFLFLFATLSADPLFNTMTLQQFNDVPTPFPPTERPLVPENRNTPFEEENLFFNFDSDAPEFFGEEQTAQIIAPNNLTPVILTEEPSPPTLQQETHLRTGDFQPLQQPLATDRQIIRLGNFYVNQGPEGIGLARPILQENSVDSITTTDVQLLFSAQEILTDSTEFNRVSTIFPFPLPNPEDEEPPPPATQAMGLTYYIQGDAVPARFTSAPSMVDFNVIGNAFHDIRYNGLTPVLSFTGADLSALFVERQRGEQRIGQEEFGRLLLSPGDKFRITLQDDAGRSQVWLLYVESEQTEAIGFFVDLLSSTFTATAPFTGFLRVALLQTEPVAEREISAEQVGEFWSTAALAQSFPPTAISMFLLWPFEWTERFGRQFNTLLARRFEVPDCGTLSSLLPLLALFDPESAQFYFDRIPEREYQIGNNRFVNQFWILAATRLRLPIIAYQTLFRPPPAYGITPSSSLTEAAFDAKRRVIPISAQVTFNEDEILWSYETFTEEADPLILFPGYKSLDPSLTPIPGFAYLDPIKGDLYGVNAVENVVTFSEGPVPGFYETDFIPADLPFTRSELSQLDLLFSTVLRKTITETDVLNAGKQTYELALTASLAVYVKERLGRSDSFIFPLVNPLMVRVKQELADWLIIHEKSGLPMPDYFVADETVGGLTSVAGLSSLSADNAAVDGNNALYSNHGTQYGWWILAAALVEQYDQRFGTEFLNRTQVEQFNITIQSPQILDLTPFKVKDFVDMLWRDPRNPDREDPDFPFNRHGNPWEGHSTANGFLYTPSPTGRNQESWAQDFNGWVGVNQYAKAIQASTQLTEEDKMGFDTLETVSQTNMQLTASSGKLVYHDEDWIYSGPYALNETVGNVNDSSTEAATDQPPGSPQCGVGVPPNARR